MENLIIIYLVSKCVLIILFYKYLFKLKFLIFVENIFIFIILSHKMSSQISFENLWYNWNHKIEFNTLFISFNFEVKKCKINNN